jgi:hypothetical protein
VASEKPGEKSDKSPIPVGHTTRQGVRDKMIAKVKQQLRWCLDALAGRCVTLAVDSGTVWRALDFPRSSSPWRRTPPLEQTGPTLDAKRRRTLPNASKHSSAARSQPQTLWLLSPTTPRTFKLRSRSSPPRAKRAALLTSSAHLLDALPELEGIEVRGDREDEAVDYRVGDVIAIIPQRCVAHASVGRQGHPG